MTVGADGDTGVDVSANGVITPYSTATETATLTVNAVNDAPLLDSAGIMSLTDIDEDEGAAGDTVAAIFLTAGGDRVTDVDAAATEGMAVISVDDAYQKANHKNRFEKLVPT